jgi:DUF917 family protein
LLFVNLEELPFLQEKRYTAEILHGGVEMPSHKITDPIAAEDLIRGLAFMGTGGGGRPDAGREYIYRDMAQGLALTWTDVADLPDDGWACSVFSVGSTAPRPADFVQRESTPGYGARDVGSAMPRALRELESYTGKPISVVFAIELGAHNSVGPLHTAAVLGLKLVDGDASGRAVPEASQVTPEMAAHPLWPAAICDEWGNAMILARATSLDVAERVAKGMSIVTKMPDPYAICGVAAYMMPVAEMKRGLVLGTLSRSLELGQIIRQARQAGEDPVAAAAQFVGGWVLFRGAVQRREWQNTGGYQIGTTAIAGAGDYAGRDFRIWFKNEHHITWRDGQPFVTSPDLLAVVDSTTGEPITNTYLAEGMAVAGVGAAAPAAFRTAAGIASLGPGHFGFDMPYRPIESWISGGSHDG